MTGTAFLRGEGGILGTVGGGGGGRQFKDCCCQNQQLTWLSFLVSYPWTRVFTKYAENFYENPTSHFKLAFCETNKIHLCTRKQQLSKSIDLNLKLYWGESLLFVTFYMFYMHMGRIFLLRTLLLGGRGGGRKGDNSSYMSRAKAAKFRIISLARQEPYQKCFKFKLHTVSQNKGAGAASFCLPGAGSGVA
jgi:hypothetical protein